MQSKWRRRWTSTRWCSTNWWRRQTMFQSSMATVALIRTNWTSSTLVGVLWMIYSRELGFLKKARTITQTKLRIFMISSVNFSTKEVIIQDKSISWRRMWQWFLINWTRGVMSKLLRNNLLKWRIRVKTCSGWMSRCSRWEMNWIWNWTWGLTTTLDGIWSRRSLTGSTELLRNSDNKDLPSRRIKKI